MKQGPGREGNCAVLHNLYCLQPLGSMGSARGLLCSVLQQPFRVDISPGRRMSDPLNCCPKPYSQQNLSPPHLGIQLSA